jgi:MFS transporter, SP family, sugar:H+ symporter
VAGSFFCGVALMIMGGLGVPQPISNSYSSGIVAMMLIFQLVYVATIGPLYYTMQAETPASRLRDKTVRLGATVNIVTIFVVSFTLPYLLDPPYANLQSKVGFIYGSICFLALGWGYLFLPELKNRSLEELEELFAAKVPLRKFGQYQASSDGIGVAVSRLERLEDSDQIITKLHVAHDEDIKAVTKTDVVQ